MGVQSAEAETVEAKLEQISSKLHVITLLQLADLSGGYPDASKRVKCKQQTSPTETVDGGHRCLIRSFLGFINFYFI